METQTNNTHNTNNNMDTQVVIKKEHGDIIIDKLHKTIKYVPTFEGLKGALFVSYLFFIKDGELYRRDWYESDTLKDGDRIWEDSDVKFKSSRIDDGEKEVLIIKNYNGTSYIKYHSEEEKYGNLKVKNEELFDKIVEIYSEGGELK